MQIGIYTKTKQPIEWVERSLRLLPFPVEITYVDEQEQAKKTHRVFDLLLCFHDLCSQEKGYRLFLGPSKYLFPTTIPFFVEDGYFTLASRLSLPIEAFVVAFLMSARQQNEVEKMIVLIESAQLFSEQQLENTFEKAVKSSEVMVMKKPTLTAIGSAFFHITFRDKINDATFESLLKKHPSWIQIDQPIEGEKGRGDPVFYVSSYRKDPYCPFAFSFLLQWDELTLQEKILRQTVERLVAFQILSAR